MVGVRDSKNVCAYAPHIKCVLQKAKRAKSLHCIGFRAFCVQSIPDFNDH